jgi:hypothetical protein
MKSRENLNGITESNFLSRNKFPSSDKHERDLRKQLPLKFQHIGAIHTKWDELGRRSCCKTDDPRRPLRAKKGLRLQKNSLKVFTKIMMTEEDDPHIRSSRTEHVVRE